MFFGVWCAISIFPMCIVAGIWQIAAGFALIVIEVSRGARPVRNPAARGALIVRSPAARGTLIARSPAVREILTTLFITSSFRHQRNFNAL